MDPGKVETLSRVEVSNDERNSCREFWALIDSYVQSHVVQ